MGTIAHTAWLIRHARQNMFSTLTRKHAFNCRSLTSTLTPLFHTPQLLTLIPYIPPQLLIPSITPLYLTSSSPLTSHLITHTFITHLSHLSLPPHLSHPPLNPTPPSLNTRQPPYFSTTPSHPPSPPTSHPSLHLAVPGDGVPDGLVVLWSDREPLGVHLHEVQVFEGRVLLVTLFGR